MEDDRYTRITLRLPKELHARLDAIADRTSKSLNAEIVGRLETSFLQAGDLDSLRDKLAAAQKQSRQNELHSIRERMKAMQYLMTLSSIVNRLPAGYFDRDPKIAPLLADLQGDGDEMMIAALEQASADLLRTQETLQEAVASGQIEVVSQDEADARRARKSQK